MKLALTAQGTELTSTMDPRFGRAKCFILIDTESGEMLAVDNTVNLNASQGAGIQSGRRVIELGAEAVITGRIGPKALATCRAGGVNVFTGATGTVSQAVEQFEAGDLDLTESPNNEP